MTARERREARQRFDGKNFDSDRFADSGYVGAKKEVKGEDDDGEDQMDIGEEQIDTGNYSDED